MTSPGDDGAASIAEGTGIGRARLRSGIELHVVEAGHCSGVAFLHGGMGDCRSWDPQIDAFAPHFRVVAYSRRHHSPNRNPPAVAQPSLDEEVEDLAGLLTALDVGSAHLVATSYGGLVALAFALRHPPLVRSLVLAEPPLHRWAAATRRGRRLLDVFIGRCWRPAAHAFDAGRDGEALRCLTDGMWGRPVYDTMPAARREAAFRNVAAMKLLTRAENPFPDLPRDAVALLAMPMLLVRGEGASALHRQGLDELAALVPRARSTVIEGAGHASPSENPTGFNSTVLEFLRAL